jgi:hypothetical protein
MGAAGGGVVDGARDRGWEGQDGELDIREGAERPQLLSGPVVLPQNLLELESIELSCPVPIDRSTDTFGRSPSTPRQKSRPSSGPADAATLQPWTDTTSSMSAP